MKTLLAMALMLACSQVSASCPGLEIDVPADSSAYEGRICAIAEKAAPALAACGLELTQPVTVEVVHAMPPERAQCLGVYWCGRNHIELLAPEDLASRDRAQQSYGGIPGESLFAATLTHELTHAAIWQALGTDRLSLTGSEYIAYAIQLSLMAPQDRDRFLALNEAPVSVPQERLNNVILGLAPDRFAALAYTHFAAPGNGCAFVSKLLSGEAVLGDIAGGL